MIGITIKREQIKNTLDKIIPEISPKIEKLNNLWEQLIKILLTLSTTLLFGSIPLYKFVLEKNSHGQLDLLWPIGWLFLLCSIVFLILSFIERLRHCAVVLNRDQQHILLLNETLCNNSESVTISIEGLVLYMPLFFPVCGFISFVAGICLLMLGVISYSFSQYIGSAMFIIAMGFLVFLLWVVYALRSFYKSQNK